MKCVNCGRDTGDRHLVCWRCRRGGLNSKLLNVSDDGVATHCVCSAPRPQFLRWFGGHQCERCGLRIIER